MGITYIIGFYVIVRCLQAMDSPKWLIQTAAAIAGLVAIGVMATLFMNDPINIVPRSVGP